MKTGPVTPSALQGNEITMNLFIFYLIMQIFLLLQQLLRINRVEPDDGWAPLHWAASVCDIDWPSSF